MATFTDMATRVLTLLGTDDHLTSAEVVSLAQTRYEHLYETKWWSRRARDFVITTVAQVSSGTTDTVTVTNGSATVTSAATPFTSAMDGRQIQISGEEQYYFVNYVSTSGVTLEDGDGNAVTWGGSSASGLSWRIFQTLYALPSAADGVLTLAHDYPIDEYDGGRSALDLADPDRSTTGDRPRAWLYAGETSGGVKQVELWPVPTSVSLLRGQYLRKAPTVTGASTVDLSLPYLTFAVAADACGLLYAKTSDPNWKDLELFYERKSQEVGAEVWAVEAERIGLPRSIGRYPRGRHRFAGTDYEVDHHLDTLR